MSGPISLDTAWLFAVFVDTALCGAFTVIFILTLWVARGRRWYFSPPFLVICLAYLINLARTGALVATISVIYIERPESTALSFQDPSVSVPPTPITRFDRYSWIAVSILAYLTLIWRLWIIWNKNIRVVLLPSLLLLVSLAIALLGVYPEHQSSSTFRPIACVVFGLEAFLSALLAVLISRKVWVAAAEKHVFRRVGVVIMESGAFMSLGMLVMFITFAAATNGLVIVWTAMAKIMGISATGIVLLLNLDVGKPKVDECATDTGFAFRVEPGPESCAESKVERSC